MPRVDITAVATRESRAKGAYARAESLRRRKEEARRLSDDRLRTKAERAAQRLGELLESPNESVALGAAREILDRVHGKPHASSSIEVSGEEPVRIEEVIGANQDEVLAVLAEVGLVAPRVLASGLDEVRSG